MITHGYEVIFLLLQCQLLHLRLTLLMVLQWVESLLSISRTHYLLSLQK